MPWRCDQQLFTRPTPACVCLQCLENPCTQDLFCTLPVALCHDHEESLCPCRRGRYTEPFCAVDQPVPLHRPEPGQDVVVGDTEKFCEFSGCRETCGDAVRRKTDGYLPVFFEEDPDSRIDYLVMLMDGHLITEVLAFGGEKEGRSGYAASFFISPRSSSGISSR